MARFVLRRVAISVLLVLASSIVVFVLVTSLGDPLAALRANPDIPAAEVANRRHELGLDDPLPTRYVSWIASFARGDFGTSLDGRAVRPLLWERVQVTLRMVLAGTVLGLLAAAVVGCWTARRARSWFDNVVMALGLVVLSLPVFWLGALLKEFAAVRLNRLFGRQLVKTLGEADPNLTGDLLERLANYASHLVLPTLALSIVLVAAWSRYVRASMIDVLGRDFIRSARARGVPEWRLTFSHGLRSSSGPVASLVAVDLGQILGGVVVLERVFGWQGMGDMLLDGVFGLDVNVVLAWLMTAALFVVLANLVADLVVARLDPRIRLG